MKVKGQIIEIKEPTYKNGSQFQTAVMVYYVRNIPHNLMFYILGDAVGYYNLKQGEYIYLLCSVDSKKFNNKWHTIAKLVACRRLTKNEAEYIESLANAEIEPLDVRKRKAEREMRKKIMSPDNYGEIYLNNEDNINDDF